MPWRRAAAFPAAASRVLDGAPESSVRAPATASATASLDTASILDADVRNPAEIRLRLEARPRRQARHARSSTRSTGTSSRLPALSDEELRAKTAEFQAPDRRGRRRTSTDPDERQPVEREALDDLLPEAFAAVKEACRRLCGRTWDVVGIPLALGHGALRRPAHRRHHAARGQDRRDGDRRGQDPGRHHAALPERAHRARRPPGHRQRLPGAPRQRVDGRDLQVPRPHRRLHPAGHGPAERRAAVRVRHHLRHQQRVRLRLPARQHGGAARAPGAARVRLRDRRRGGLGPDRRGAHAAHHLGPGRAQRPGVRRAEAAGRARWCARRTSGSTSALAEAERAAQGSREGVRGRAQAAAGPARARPSTSAS